MRDREKLYRQHAPLKDELGQLLMVKHCAEIAIKGERKRTQEETLLIQP